jgi:hypothetical protein
MIATRPRILLTYSIFPLSKMPIASDSFFGVEELQRPHRRFESLRGTRTLLLLKGLVDPLPY